MDANEHIYNKSLGKELTDAAGLDMSEVVGSSRVRRLVRISFEVQSRGQRRI